MTDNKELIARLRKQWEDEDAIEAADRIEALTKERDEADDLAKAAFADGASNNIRLAETAHRVKALTKERDEAWKRAAHAEKMWGEAEVKLAECEARLGKAVDAINVATQCEPRGLYPDHVPNYWLLRTTLAEIKLQSSEFATQKGESHD